MEAAFWHQRWEENRIGFHQSDFNGWLKTWWADRPMDEPVLVPLCGKSRDMVWLCEQGHPVHGFELSPLAVEQFFGEQGWTPERTEVGPYQRLGHGDLHIYQGDFFAAWQLDQRYRLVYDRASLIALPAPLRLRYAQQLASMVLEGGEILLVTVEYQPDPQHEPPFSVSELEVRRLFEPHFSVSVLGRQSEVTHPRVVSGQLSYFDEVCYRLVRRAHKTLPPLM